MSTTSNDAFCRALKRLSKPELQALYNAMAADDTDLTPRERLTKHLRLAWFRSLTPVEMSTAWLAMSRHGAVDVPPDLLGIEQPLPTLDSVGLPTVGSNDTDISRGGRGPPS